MTNYSYRILPLIVSVALFSGCYSSGEGGFGDVHGSVSVNSQPAPQGTRVRFQHTNDKGTAFYAVVDDQGQYRYQPPKLAPLKEGTYHVAVDPVRSTTVIDDSGLSIEVASDTKVKKFGSFSDFDKSNLKTDLSQGSVEFNIEIKM